MFLWYIFVAFCLAVKPKPVVSFRAFAFNIFINGLCDEINHSNCLLFADYLKIYRANNSPSECLLLQSVIDCVHECFSANFMKPDFGKIRAISFTRKMSV
jgi:hypothetical protein